MLANLRTTLRAALVPAAQDPGDAEGDVVARSRDRCGANLTEIDCDLWRFDRAARAAAAGDDTTTLASLAEATKAYSAT